MNRFVWLVRRELWEHRAIWIAPAVVLAILALVAATGNINLGEVDVDTSERISELPPEKREALRAEIEKEFGDQAPAVMERIEQGEGGTLLMLLPEQKQIALVAVVYSMLGALMSIVLGIIAIFYALDALYSDRRDRSVLFWKSLPLSDAETVLAKFTVAALVIPLVALCATLLAQLLVATGGSIKLALAGSPAGLMWNPQALLAGATSAVLIAVITVLWYSPLLAYLLLASAWAPKSPFLWGIVPPVAAMVLERIAVGTSHLGDFLVWRLFGPFEAVAADGSDMPAIVVNSDNLPQTAAVLTQRLVDFVASPGMILGLVAGAALIVGAISLRRYRDENT